MEMRQFVTLGWLIIALGFCGCAAHEPNDGLTRSGVVCVGHQMEGVSECQNAGGELIYYTVADGTNLPVQARR